LWVINAQTCAVLVGHQSYQLLYDAIKAGKHGMALEKKEHAAML